MDRLGKANAASDLVKKKAFRQKQALKSQAGALPQKKAARSLSLCCQPRPACLSPSLVLPVPLMAVAPGWLV